MNATPATADEWMTVDELSAWLKLSREWVYDNVQANRIPYHRLGRQLRFRLTEVEKWLDDAANYPVATIPSPREAPE